MKKEYEAPKAEKMEFNYSEAVVASGKCNATHVVGDDTGDLCSTLIKEDTVEKNSEFGH